MTTVYVPDPAERDRYLERVENAAFSAAMRGASLEEVLERAATGHAIGLHDLSLRYRDDEAA